MPVEIITESGLDFHFEQERLFRPEAENFYQRLASKYSIKICDMIYLSNNGELWFMEVKSSAPREPGNFVQDIHKKFLDSLLIYVGAYADRKNTSADYLPPVLQNPAILSGKIRLILIVKDYPEDKLVSLQDSLYKECRAFEKLFSLEKTVVYNQDKARRFLRIPIHPSSS